MKINRESMLTTLDAISPGLSPKGVIEQSQCFILRKNRAYAYNDEEFCYAPLDLGGIEGAVAAKPLLNLLRNLKEDEISLEQADGELLVRGKGRRAGVTMDKEILLPVAKVERPKEWVKVSEAYGEAVLLVQECAGRDSEKDVAAACVHFTPDWVESFDNYQMIRHKLKTKVPQNTIIKARSAKAAAGIGVTHVGFTNSWMYFKNEMGLVMGCRTYVGEFFDLGGNFEIDGHKVTLPKGLAAAASIGAFFSSENKDNNVVMVEIKKNKLRMKAMGVSGWYEEVKEVKYKGPEMKFVISPGVLKQVVEKYNEVHLGEERIKVDGGAWVFVTMLGTPEGE